MKKVNSTMVARLAGVSQGTVSLVANNSARVSDETRRKVIDAARVLGYPLRQCRLSRIRLRLRFGSAATGWWA